MTRNSLIALSPQMARAVEDLCQAILRKYPTTAFRVSRGEEPPEVLLWAFADVDDPDVVMDAVSDQLGDLLINDGLFITLMPISRLARAARSGLGAPSELDSTGWIPSQPVHVPVLAQE